MKNTFLTVGLVSLASVLSVSAIDRPKLDDLISPNKTAPHSVDIPLPAEKSIDEAVPTVWLGIVPMPMHPALMAQLELNGNAGVIVRALGPQSPAVLAGIKEYDVIMSVNGVAIHKESDIARALKSCQSGQEIKVDIIRAMKPQSLTVTLAEKPKNVTQVDGVLAGSEALKKQWSDVDPDAGTDVQRRIIPLLKSQGTKLARQGKAFSQAAQAQHEELAARIQALSEQFDAQLDQKMLDLVAPLISQGVPKIQSRLNQFQEALDEIENSGIPSLPMDPLIQMSNSYNFRVSDNEGTLLISRLNGKTTLKATDPQGKLIFEGPYDTDVEKNAIPSILRERMEKIQFKGN